MDIVVRTVREQVILAFAILAFLLPVNYAASQVLLPQVGNITTVAGNGHVTTPPSWSAFGPVSGVGGLATSAELSGISYLTVDSIGNIYLGAGMLGRAGHHFTPYKISSSTGVLNTIPALSGSQVWGLATDSNNNLYIANGPSTVQLLNVATGLLATIAGNGGFGCSGDNGPATGAEFGTIGSLAVGPNGNVYIADTGCAEIRMITASTGIITTIAGNGTLGCSGENVIATSAEITGGIAVDNIGNVYIESAECETVRKVNIATGIITTVAGNGTTGYSGDGGLATDAELHYPAGVAVDAPGNIYIADSFNNRIRIVSSSTGIITTLAGTDTPGFSGDGGPAVDAELSGPQALALGTDANVYFGDSPSISRIRVIGTPVLSTSILYPAYQITSIVYAPPGNKSQDGFTDSVTSGTTTTLGDSFANASTITFREGISALGTSGSASQSFGVSDSAANTQAFTETFSNATSVSNQSNANSSNAINHLNDLFLIWLNPEISLTLQDATPVSFNVSVRGQVEPDILQIFAGNLSANPSGNTTVPAAFLNHQIDPATGAQAPGLASLCVHLNVPEYSANACTLADQCGCQASDFAPILALDPLLNFPGTESPLDANTDSASICGALPTPSGNCRYVPVPDSKGSAVQEIQTLVGLASTNGNYSCNSYTQSDANSTIQTLGGSTSESVSVSFEQGAPLFSLTEANTITWTQSHSIGTSNGLGNSQNVTLCSATIGCGENISIYEDTLYHTFVFQQPTGNISCP